MMKKYLTKEFRTKGIVGFVEVDDLTEHNTSVLFYEWWNGEGMNFEISRKNEKLLRFDLTSEEMLSMAAIFVSTGFIDIEDIKAEVEKIKRKEY